MSQKKMKDLRHRAWINGTAAILLVLLVVFAEIGYFRILFAAAVAAIAGMAVWEYYQLVQKKGIMPARLIGILGTLLYVFALFVKTQGPFSFWGSLLQKSPEILLFLTFFAFFAYSAFLRKEPILSISTSFLGIVYIAVPMGLIIRIVYFFAYGGSPDPYFEGSWWLCYLIAVTKAADMGGYFVGSQFGKTKLAHKLSPNKTIEGLIGGLVSSLLISVLIVFIGKRYGHVFVQLTYFEAIWLGVATGFVGQIGDLAESLLKRDARVKDSNKLPGVGGILDMVDSLLFTSPIVYLFLKMHYIPL